VEIFEGNKKAVVYNGAIPILIDIGVDHNMGVTQSEKAILPQTKAVILVHLNGRLCDMKRLMEIVAGHDNRNRRDVIRQ